MDNHVLQIGKHDKVGILFHAKQDVAQRQQGMIIGQPLLLRREEIRGHQSHVFLQRVLVPSQWGVEIHVVAAHGLTNVVHHFSQAAKRLVEIAIIGLHPRVVLIATQIWQQGREILYHVFLAHFQPKSGLLSHTLKSIQLSFINAKLIK